MALTSKKITQITKNQDTNTILLKNADGDIVTACYGGGLIAEEREDGAKVVVLTTDRKVLVSLTVDDITTPSVTDSQDLITQLSEDFFFDLGGLAPGVSSVSGSRTVTSVGGPAVYETLFEITVPNNQIYSIPNLVVKTTNTATGEYFIAWYRIQLRATALGVVSAPGSVFSTQVGETFATDVAIAFDYATANKMKYTISNGTAARTLKWEFFYELHKSNF